MHIYQLHLPLPKKLRSKVTKIVLDWAEALPKRKSFLLTSLQSARKFQREQAQTGFERSQLPKGSDVEILAVRMIEVIEFEDFKKLSITLKKMFHDLAGFYGDETFEAYFQELGNSLNPGWWMNVGVIYREKRLPGRNIFYLPKLPSEVDHISVNLHKVLPSLIVITFDVFFNATANKTLEKLHNQTYLPEARIESIDLVDKTFNISHFSLDHGGAQAVIEWLTQTRNLIENAVAPYISGVFMQERLLSSMAKLPAIEIYDLRRDDKPRESFAKWAAKADGWCDSMGFELNFGTYNNKEFAFSWSHRQRFQTTKSAHRVLLFHDQFKKDIDMEMYGGDERYGMIKKLRYFLDGMLVPLIAIEYLGSKIEKMKNRRASIFASMVKKLEKNSGFKRQLNLHASLQQESRTVERFLLEFDQCKKHIEDKLREAQPESLIYTNLIPKRKPPLKNLKESAWNEIGFLKNTIDEHLNFLNRAFSEYIQILNVDAIYRLQIATTWLTFIALLVAILGILDNWQNIIDLLSK